LADRRKFHLSSCRELRVISGLVRRRLLVRHLLRRDSAWAPGTRATQRICYAEPLRTQCCSAQSGPWCLCGTITAFVTAVCVTHTHPRWVDSSLRLLNLVPVPVIDSLHPLLFISRSCPILVLTTVLIRSRHANVKNGAKTNQGPTTFSCNTRVLPEKMRFENI
jgi:hypothetical protein